MDKRLLSVLICPSCHAPLKFQAELGELWCRAEGVAFSIRNGIPVMIPEEARALSADEKLS